MDLTEAVTWLNETTDGIDGIEYDHTAAAIRTVLAELDRLREIEARAIDERDRAVPRRASMTTLQASDGRKAAARSILGGAAS